MRILRTYDGKIVVVWGTLDHEHSKPVRELLISFNPLHEWQMKYVHPEKDLMSAD